MPLVNLGTYSEEFGRSLQLPKCNRAACTNEFAPCFNSGTNTYYCIACARDINKSLAWDGKLLCDIPVLNKLYDMECLWFDDELYVGTQKLEDWEAANPGRNIRSNGIS